MEQPVNILVAMPPFQPGIDQVRRHTGDGTMEIVEPWPPDTAVPAELIAGRSVLFANFPPANVADMSELAWIQLGSAGYQQLEGLPLQEMGVQVTTASGVNDVPIAEWCLAMMLLFERDVRGLLARQAERAWERATRFQSELRGHRIGIVGYGNIGREVARLCTCLGLEVWSMSWRPIGPRPGRFTVPGTGDPDGTLPQRTFLLDQMADFLPYLDFVVLCLPLTSNTRGIIGDRELALMQPSAVLLNPSRGPLVDEKALIDALANRKIGGAALDAHYQYPLPPEHPLWSLPNVVLTPHISGSDGSPHYQSRLWELFTTNLARFRRGDPLLNQIHLWDAARHG